MPPFTVKLAVSGCGAGVTVSVACFVVPENVPEIVTGVDPPTALVLMVKFALVDPAGTVTLAGTVAAPVLLLCSVTTMPPPGAAAESVAVPWDVAPPCTEVGFTETDESDTVGAAAVTVRVAC